MKRKIVIGLGIYTVVFLLANLYVVDTIQGATNRLDKLIMLHQVEILREHYLIQIRRVQTDLTLRGTRHARDFETMVLNGQRMGGVVDACFECHHAGPVRDRIEDLKQQTLRYQDALSRVLTMRANAERLAEEQDNAFQIGEDLIHRVSDMIAMTASRLEASTQRALGEIDRTKYILFVLIGLTPLVSAALGYIFITGLTKPVGVLLNSTRKLKTGDLDHRVTGLKDEFGELGASFNEMAAALKEHMVRRRRAEQMAVLGELSAGLAHEIKNPLAGIKVAMEVLSGEAHLSDEDRAVVEKVGQEVVHLEALMKSLLSFARPPKPQPVEMDVNALVNSTLALHAARRSTASQGRPPIEIVKELGALPPALVDPMQLQQVLLNLVINAIDAMPEGGTLTVRTALEDGNAIRIDVADTGKGVDPALAEKIFHPFFTTKRGGTGLGLAVSRQLVEQQGGSLTLAADPGGAVFSIRIPRRGGAAGAAA